MTANILMILERGGRPDPALAPLMDEARRRLAAYRVGHRAFHWPLRQGRSAMADAPPLWRHRFVHLDPDADCTCLVQLARRDPGLDDAIVEDLAFYRADGFRFRLPRFQRTLPAAGGSYLTWFPPRERCRPGKIETVDAGADANILWYLASIGRLDAPGAHETTTFLVQVVRAALTLRAPFRISMYYPRGALLLYLITRAAVWGEIPALLSLKTVLVAQLQQCPATSTIDLLCVEAALRLWGAKGSLFGDLPVPTGKGAFYVGPLLAWPLQRFALLKPLAAARATQIGFRSEALEWALYQSLVAGNA